MTPEKIELPTVSNVDQDLQREPDIREGYVLLGGPVKWMPYKPQGAKHTKRKGRWQAMNEYGGWDNCETPAQIWSGFISYEEMAAHIIALEARVKTAEELADSVQKEGAARGNYLGTPTDRGGHSGPKGQAKESWFAARCKMSDTIAAFRATGGHDNE